MSVVCLDFISSICETAIGSQEEFLALKEKIRMAVRVVHPGIGFDSSDDMIDVTLYLSVGRFSDGEEPEYVEFYLPSDYGWRT